MNSSSRASSDRAKTRDQEFSTQLECWVVAAVLHDQNGKIGLAMFSVEAGSRHEAIGLTWDYLGKESPNDPVLVMNATRVGSWSGGSAEGVAAQVDGDSSREDQTPSSETPS